MEMIDILDEYGNAIQYLYHSSVQRKQMHNFKLF